MRIQLKEEFCKSQFARITNSTIQSIKFDTTFSLCCHQHDFNNYIQSISPDYFFNTILIIWIFTFLLFLLDFGVLVQRPGLLHGTSVLALCTASPDATWSTLTVFPFQLIFVYQQIAT